MDITIKVNIPTEPLNTRAFVANLFGIVDDSPEFALVAAAVPAPDTLAFVQATKAPCSFEFAPSLTEAIEDKDGKLILVDISVGRGGPLADATELFYSGIEFLAQQVEEEPVNFGSVIDGDVPCRAFVIQQHRDNSITGIGWNVAIARLA